MASSLPALSLFDFVSLEHSDQGPNNALINTLNNILESPLHCSTMKSTNPSLPPFLAPLVQVADVLDGKDFWKELGTTNTNIVELQRDLTNFNLLDDDLIFDSGGDFEECSTMCEETKMFSKANVGGCDFSLNSTVCDLTEPFEFWQATVQKKKNDKFTENEEEITVLFDQESNKLKTAENSPKSHLTAFGEKDTCNQCYKGYPKVL